jgi:UDP-sugar transporter A1/2/3
MSKQSGIPAPAGPTWRDPKGTQMTTEWRSVMLYPIPSIIYLFHNNVQFYTMAYVDAATYQILGNLKIVTTGILFRFALKKTLTRTQWAGPGH